MPRLALAAAALALLASTDALRAHGSLVGSRVLQVYQAGPSGATPAPFNNSYYTWNQNSNNFTNYASPGFTYASAVPDGTLHSAGVNDGQQSFLNFSALNTPSASWATTPITAGKPFASKFLATAPHEPSRFDVYLTEQGFDAATETLGWADLEFLGRWKIGDAARPVSITQPSGSPLAPMSYDWLTPIPADRAGLHTLLVVWQREDPAGEAFFATRDLTVTPARVTDRRAELQLDAMPSTTLARAAVPEPGAALLALVAAAGAARLPSRRTHREP